MSDVVVNIAKGLIKVPCGAVVSLVLILPCMLYDIGSGSSLGSDYRWNVTNRIFNW